MTFEPQSVKHTKSSVLRPLYVMRRKKTFKLGKKEERQRREQQIHTADTQTDIIDLQYMNNMIRKDVFLQHPGVTNRHQYFYLSNGALIPLVL